LRKCIDDEPTVEHKGIFEAVLDAFIKRIDHKAEYLGAALLDPCQLYSTHVNDELTHQNTTCEDLLKELIQKYEIMQTQESSRTEAHSQVESSVSFLLI
jgi:hypothetical protein